MIEIMHFVFSSFWVFMGCVIMLIMMVALAGSIRGQGPLFIINTGTMWSQTKKENDKEIER